VKSKMASNNHGKPANIKIWTHKDRASARGHGTKPIPGYYVTCSRGLTPEQEANRELLKLKIKAKKIDPKRQALLKLIEEL